MSAAAAGSVGTRVVLLAVSLVTGVLAARVLGPHDRGVVAVVLACASIFGALLTVGMETANLRYAGGSVAAHRRTVWWSLRHVGTVGVGVAAAWGALAVVVGPAVRIGLDPVTFALALALGPVVLLSSLLGTAEIGRSHASVYNLTVIGGLLVYGVLLVVLTATGRADTNTVIGAYLLGQACAAAVLLVRALPLSREPGPPEDRAAYRSFARRVYAPNLAQFAMVRSQVPAIHLIAGAGAVGVYSVAVPFAEMLLVLPVALSLILVPAVAHGGADWHTVRRMSVRTLLITAVGAGLLAAVAPLAFPLLFGAQFAEAVPVLWAMLPGLIVLAVARTAQSYLTAVDRPGPPTLAAVSAAVAGLLAMAVLIPRFGTLGAGLAVSAGYVLYGLVVGWAFLGYRPAQGRRNGPTNMTITHGGRHTRSPRRERESVLPAWGRAAGVLVAGAAAGVVAVQDTTLLLRLAALAAVVLVITLPGFGLYCIALAVPASQLPLALAPDTTPLLALILCTLVGTLLRGRPARRGMPAVLIVTALTCLLALGVAIGGQPSQAFRSVAAIAVPLACIPLIDSARARSRSVLLVFAVAATAVGLVHAGLALVGTPMLAEENPALAESLSGLNHNAWGPMLLLALAVLLSRLRPGVSGPARLLTVAGVVAVTVSVVLSYSRSTYIGGALLLLCFVIQRRRTVALALTGMVVVLTVGLTGVQLVPEKVAERIAYTTVDGRLDSSSSVRLDLWLSALRMAGDYPVTGVGFQNFRAHLPEYFQSEITVAAVDVQIDSLNHAHNTYLTVLTQTGLVGVLLVGGLLFIVIRRLRRRLRAGDSTAEAAVLGMAAIGGCSLFGEPLLTLPVLIPFVLLLAVATARQPVETEAASGERRVGPRHAVSDRPVPTPGPIGYRAGRRRSTADRVLI
ncbi:Membrane protein involved in the export of O-antigen and teichoic acid [Micromonospora chokoriensis]|uniref:Membrane protein involved in the export of O-antigen and teichoic acid n=1 Tax=Micromonospora chokoriensis TaxID=356851 RepID=A0A1C4Z068_9ACTN|nr:Membrane protein involved in the export of O-antigen and teichoic acid [Micromonospora chokoriensis]